MKRVWSIEKEKLVRSNKHASHY